MKTLCYYIEINENYENFEKALNLVIMLVPCFVSTEIVEMNYMEVTIVCRQEDVIAIQTALAEYL